MLSVSHKNSADVSRITWGTGKDKPARRVNSRSSTLKLALTEAQHQSFSNFFASSKDLSGSYLFYRLKLHKKLSKILKRVSKRSKTNVTQPKV